VALLVALTCFGLSHGLDAKNAALIRRLLLEQEALEVDPKPLLGRPVTPGVYLGLALDGLSPAFDGDIRRARDGLFLQAASGPVMLLSNLKAEPDTEPHADVRTLPTVAQAAGRWLSKHALHFKSRALAVVTIGAHGGEDMLMVRLADEPPQSVLRAEYLQQFLNDLGDGPALVIISACHSGSFVPALRAPNRIIIAAAAADRVSFGCGKNSASTVFMRALLDKTLNRSLSLNELFGRARNRISGLETRLQMEHSLPQIDVGSDMEAFAGAPIEHWSSALREFRVSKPQLTISSTSKSPQFPVGTHAIAFL
jgi:hypothetical protein